MQKTEEEWKKTLTPEEYSVLREKGTEPAFTGAYWDNHEKGVYRCRACGVPLFSSDAKFDSGTGWPSFSDLMNNKAVELKADDSMGMQRTEITCANCGSHLGHVFDDLPAQAGGPKTLPDGRQATGKRYCINSCSLDFKKEEGDK
ncbi:MAG: Peptide methionine sulfoxide reductase MsrB [Candidatus Giovannonibacteria bacterium GW2011_GWA2_44_13b]|uniref:peptide-methionine (R)-S-oxide reductase n=2 Tax=Candidatus Giovannoniibacteriota TaxID=1752738 RepID=A0A0G1H2V3_9BACT|nr:MAG: Peptide methionine sulfoxide reductase MsrB [Candidatus Giovannonibacteria bacterium GW2011_GWA2_44_13b]OGF83176.1 MAG: peptide-methionine (R)-S-oxide reductase [Candidatus Giovannonibacteria bacterium RIFCSPLOWO2_01_FULL_44_16]